MLCVCRAHKGLLGTLEYYKYYIVDFAQYVSKTLVKNLKSLRFISGLYILAIKSLSGHSLIRVLGE